MRTPSREVELLLLHFGVFTSTTNADFLVLPMTRFCQYISRRMIKMHETRSPGKHKGEIVGPSRGMYSSSSTRNRSRNIFANRIEESFILALRPHLKKSTTYRPYA